ITALLLGDDHDGLAVEKRSAADESLIVVELAVAVQLLKVFANQPDVVEGVGAVGMAGDLDPLPRREICVDVALRLSNALLKAGHFLGKVQVLLKRALMK